MIDQLRKLQSAFIDAGFSCQLTFGKQIASDLTEKDVANKKIVLFFPTLNVETEIMTWKMSPAISLSGTITSIAKTDVDAVALSHEVLRTLGFLRESGDVGMPPAYPVTILNEKAIVYFIEISSVNCSAVPLGNFWAVDQNLKLVFYCP